MAERVARLEPAVAIGGGRYYLYDYPNPALTEALIGPRLGEIVADWQLKVLATYVGRLADRPHIGDKHPGAMAAAATALPPRIGGYRGDRWIGEIVVEIEYASADEFGRDAYAPYEGHHDLREALYLNLPAI